ncbi:hypothetical protein AGMMS49992_30520 [Clostridia bacterium]|nr:hypothetical protein AGMMS49992_30520 [Clostridia bacterium]
MKLEMNKHGIFTIDNGANEERHEAHNAEALKECHPVNVRRPTPYERTKAAVYATGNKWAIENFNATH